MTYRHSDELQATREHVRRLASERGNVFRREDLRTWGVDQAAIPSMLRRRWWVRLWHGVYADAEVVAAADRSPEARHVLRAAAAIAALPLPAYAFGPTAAAVDGLPVQRQLLDRVHLVRDSRSDLRALQRRITSGSEPIDVELRTRPEIARLTTVVRGIPTVERDLAAVSTAAQSSPEWAVATLDAIAWQDPGAVDRLTELSEDWHKLRGIGVVRQALPLVRTGAQTPLESISRVRLVGRGMPEPELQVPMYDDDGMIGIVDMWFETLRVIGEADGLMKYSDRADLIAEKKREDRLRATRCGVARWTWDAMLYRTASVHRLILAASPLRSAALGRRWEKHPKPEPI